MFWIATALVVASLVASYWLAPKLPKITTKAEDLPIPTAEEGRPIPVLFGTREIKNPNVLYFERKTPEKRADGQFVYGAYVHYGFCHGALDELRAIYYGNELVWSGSAKNDGVKGSGVRRFGLDGSPKLQNFVVNCTYNLGAINTVTGPDAGALSSTRDDIAEWMRDFYSPSGEYLGGPRFYGIASLLLRGSLGTSPYLADVSAVGTRIHLRHGGSVAQWYDEKAEIPSGKNREDIWKYRMRLSVLGDAADLYSDPLYDDSEWDEGPGGVGNAPVGTYGYKTPLVRTSIQGVAPFAGGEYENSWVSRGMYLWLRGDLGPQAAEELGVRCWHDDSARLWFNGTLVALTPITSTDDDESAHFNSRGTIPASLINTDGPNVIAYCVRDSYDNEGNAYGNNQFIYAGIQVGPNKADPAACRDMNLAHVVREALTDTIWGASVPETRIDDVAFTAAADQLYDERLGVSILWDRQSSYEDFLKEMLRHANAVLYIDPTTGKWVLELIRDDYVVEELPVLDDSNVERIEDGRRRLIGELVNTVTVTYTASVRGDTGSVTTHDAGLLRVQGAVVPYKIDYPGLMNHFAASKAAIRHLRALSSPLWSGVIYASRAAAGFHVGTPFVLNAPGSNPEAMGLVLRATQVELGDGRTNKVKVTAVEDVFPTAGPAVTIPSGVGGTPVSPPPSLGDSTMLYPSRVVTSLYKGQAVCVFRAFAACGPALFPGWTEISPGVMQKNEMGPLTSVVFDGVNPDPYNPNGSPLIGKTVFAFGGAGIPPADRRFQGPWVVDDVGARIVNPDTPLEHPEDTYARMHRHPDFDESSNFVEGMFFQAQTGDDYGGDYFMLTSAAVTLGVTEMEWSHIEGPTNPGEYDYFALTAEQRDALNTSPEKLYLSKEDVGGDFPNIFPTPVGSPSLNKVPSGLWEMTVENARLEMGSPGDNTQIGFSVYRWNVEASIYEKLLELLTPALNLVPTTYTMRLASGAFACSKSDRLVIVPALHTDSATAVRASFSYGGASPVTALKVPFKLGTVDALPDRPAFRLASFADGVVTVPDRAWAADVVVPAGETITGLVVQDGEPGDTLTLTVYRGTGTDPVTVEHNGTAPTGAQALFLANELDGGTGFDDVAISGARMTLALQLRPDESVWQRTNGGTDVHGNLLGRNPDVGAGETGAHDWSAIGPSGREHKAIAAASIASGIVTMPASCNVATLAMGAETEIKGILRTGWVAGQTTRIVLLVTDASTGAPKAVRTGQTVTAPAYPLRCLLKESTGAPIDLVFRGPKVLEFIWIPAAGVWQQIG